MQHGFTNLSLLGKNQLKIPKAKAKYHQKQWT